MPLVPRRKLTSTCTLASYCTLLSLHCRRSMRDKDFTVTSLKEFINEKTDIDILQLIGDSWCASYGWADRCQSAALTVRQRISIAHADSAMLRLTLGSRLAMSKTSLTNCA
ncbi:hypothetical protein K503DRAFT_766877 [Rhizopogon vinicolor AM-OR11-026]|uniref:Uncharacterized protein n=1 Tax=Rhizopogon vinicolor AM-OR11-026 TaxID=1314800 RepID=A0A1B7NBR3_9AGAM|nr:hypothetical protein K503DRAFT_766877 [Rhizopogon vinicolor AM-OR11-026]